MISLSFGTAIAIHDDEGPTLDVGNIFNPGKEMEHGPEIYGPDGAAPAPGLADRSCRAGAPGCGRLRRLPS
jgi:hypothetical protein